MGVETRIRESRADHVVSVRLFDAELYFAVSFGSASPYF